VPTAAGLPPAVRRAADALLVFTAATIPLSTTGMQAGAVGLFALALVAGALGWGVVRRTPLDGALAILAGALVLSTLASAHPGDLTGWSRPWVVIAYFGVYWWCDRERAVRLVGVLVASAGVVAAYAILQHFTGADWYRQLLGRATVVRPRDAAMRGYAAFGFFRSYLTFGHAMLLPLAWAGALALGRRRVAAVAFALLVVAIVFSTARGAWLAMGAVVVGLAAVGAAGRVRPRRLAPVLGATVLAAALAFAIAPGLGARLGSMFAFAGENAGRVAIYQANLDIVHDHPIFGVGFGAYRRASAPYYAARPRADRVSHAHNDYLQLAAAAGLVGLAAFCLLWATALLRGWDAVARAANGATWAAAAGAWVGIVGFLVGGLTQYNFGDNEVALPMWVALAVLMRLRDPS
jgi:O-antigen ligase